MKILFLYVLLVFSFLGNAQELIKGVVVDKTTNEPLAFVNIVFGESNRGVTTDVDGKFEFYLSDKTQSIQLSYIGYKTRKVNILDYKNQGYRIGLNSSSAKIREVIILPEVNPAHRLILNAIKNKKINNPEVATQFYYESYNKLVFTSPIDSNSRSNLDSLTINNATAQEKLDSIPLSKTAFIMESVADRNHFPPDFSNEMVTQSRISGLKTPFFSLLGTQLQSFSLYKDFITIYGINYLSPISNGSINKYLFVIEDTIYKGVDTSFIISFRPKKNKNFQGLEGVLALSSNKYAVENFKAKQSDDGAFPVKIVQKYTYINNQQWFPTQLNIDITFRSDIITLVGQGRSYFRNIELKSKVDRKKIDNIVIKTDPNIIPRNDLYWDSLRQVPLSPKEQLSYHYIDSIGDAENLDKMVFITRGLLRGFVPIKSFNLTLNKLVKFNQYENVRLGLGLETNDKIIKNVRIGGYGGYGFKDKAWKYGSHLKWQPKSKRLFQLHLAYSIDLIGVGDTKYNDEVASFTATSNVQNFINDIYDRQEIYKINTSFRAFRDFHFTLFGNQQKRTFLTDYQFNDLSRNEILTSNFNLTEAGVDLRYSYKEKFGELLGVIVPVETKYPSIYLKYTRGFSGLLDGDFDYNRLDFSFYKSAPIKSLGRVSLQINAGYIDEVLPLTALYGMRGIFDPEIYIASSFSFETMFPNEFYANQYVNFFFRHNFGSLLFKSPKFKPQLLLVTSYAIGALNSKTAHENFDFKTLEHGYSESGIQLNNLIRLKYIYDGIYFGFGAGAYYRYGAYANPTFEDNFAFKLTTSLTM